MNTKRKLITSYAAPVEQGFLGEGHTARAVIRVPYKESDPFILLMDDTLDKKDNTPAGGPHPHSGFETVSLMVDGEFREKTETMKAGDFQIMTAGSGIVHTEAIEQPTKGRLLQMWLNLPSRERWAKPRVQNLPADHVPVIQDAGTSIRLYSGTLAGVSSPVLNHVPLLAAEFQMQPNALTVQNIPASFNAFIFVLQGSVHVGEDERLLKQDETGWLGLPGSDGESELIMKSGSDGARFVLYAAKPQGETFVSKGPFIGDTHDDIKKVYTQYVRGELQHIAAVDAASKFDW